MKVILLSCMVSIVILLAIVVPSLFEKSVFAQNTMTTTTTTMIGSKIPYYIFPAEIEGIEEEILKVIPHNLEQKLDSYCYNIMLDSCVRLVLLDSLEV